VAIRVFQGEREITAYNKELGIFELTGLPPTPRGVPQIKVTFDIDANGIVNVSAQDMGTGKSQAMTITSMSALAHDEINRMVRDAEQYAKDDRRRRDEIETRNRAESLVYQTAKFITDHNERLPAGAKDKLNRTLSWVQEVLKSADFAAVRAAINRLDIESHALGYALHFEEYRVQSAQTATSVNDKRVVDNRVMVSPLGVRTTAAARPMPICGAAMPRPFPNT